MITEQDIPHIEAAIESAKLSVAEDAQPRASVGTVLVKDNMVRAAAHRGETGPGEHAEFCLLARNLEGEDVSGATLYTTLEPCLDDCVDRILQRGVRRVIIGCPDPHPFRSMRSLRRLKAAGIEVDLFPRNYMLAVEELNREFIAHRGRDPFDGRMSSG